LGKYHEATDEDYRNGEEFCETHPPNQPRPVPSAAIEAIQIEGARAWNLSQPGPNTRFIGHIDNIEAGGKEKGRAVAIVHTKSKCRETCLVSNLPIVAGMYDVQGKIGIYYEVQVHNMKGSIAIGGSYVSCWTKQTLNAKQCAGTACLPYPDFRFPGWNRLSAALHLDDFRKFFEDPDGGRDYDVARSIESGDIVGCGYEFSTGSIFFTYNGQRLADAFTGIYMPRQWHDVFAAIGVEGESEFEVNFGGALFKWPEGNEWQWRVEGLAGTLSNTDGPDEELPAYSRMV